MKLTKQRLKEIIKEELSSLMTEAEARLFKYRDTAEVGKPVRTAEALNLTLLLRDFGEQTGLPDGEVADRFEILEPVGGEPTGKPFRAITYGVTP